jgi:hypothetical protein
METSSFLISNAAVWQIVVIVTVNGKALDFERDLAN